MNTTQARFEALNAYQNEIGNLRSHHWKYWLDLYTNCAYDCSYCVYRAAGRMGRVQAHPERLEGLSKDLERLDRRGIVYLGPRSDVYQALEKRMRLTRRALEIFHRTETPVFLVTRSELILDDIPILKALAAKGLIEISISVPSKSVHKTLEPRTIPVRERLDLIRAIKSNGIPVSVHMSPIMPHLDDDVELKSLLDEFGSAGADCVYACVLGMTEAYYDVLRAKALEIDPVRGERFQQVYGVRPDGGVRSAEAGYILSLMQALSLHAAMRGLGFASVHLPPLDTIERVNGIFRYKVPTVGDMTRHFDRIGAIDVSWPVLYRYIAQFAAVDEAFVDAVHGFWDRGQLFKNTYFHPGGTGETARSYRRSGKLDLAITNMRVTSGTN